MCDSVINGDFSRKMVIPKGKNQSENRVKATYWDVVINNYSDELVSEFKKVCTQWDFIEDAGFEFEVAPTTGTKHMQGWIKLIKQTNKSYILNGPLNQGILVDKCSIRPARNWRALKNYCQKEHDGTYWNLSDDREKKEELKRIETFKKQQEEANEWEEKYKKRHPNWETENDGYED